MTQQVVIRNFAIPLRAGGIAVVSVPVPMSEEDFDVLMKTLESWKAALVHSNENL